MSTNKSHPICGETKGGEHYDKVQFTRRLKAPLPPATPREILEVCAAAPAFCAIVAGIIAGITFLLSDNETR